MSNRVSLRDLNEREVLRQQEVDESNIRDGDGLDPFDLRCDQHDEYEEFDLEAEFCDLEHDYEREIQEGFARDRAGRGYDRHASNPYNDGPESDPGYGEWYVDTYIRPHDDSGDELNLGANYEWLVANGYLANRQRFVESYLRWFAGINPDKFPVEDQGCDDPYCEYHYPPPDPDDDPDNYRLRFQSANG